MLGLVWLLVALPLAGFILLVSLGRRLGRRGATAVGVGSVGLAFALAAALGLFFMTAPPGQVHVLSLWTWFAEAELDLKVALRLDALSMVMALVVTGVGFLIHVYSTEFMAEDEGYARFFAYMNLFVASMLLLVLADNLVLLYVGWEGVGLCSFLLIGFWYHDLANGRAARKAFVVTRVGDVAMAIGLFLLFTTLGTLDIQPLMERAAATWPAGSTLPVLAAALLLGGAVGKSAQLPLQTWLPDAMAGPTPVSALIHAATMVTAGVYLIARTHVLFALAPQVEVAVAVIGALTLLLAGFAALAQRDIKRVLAYSTISQLGYMFLALGVGAWTAAIFHLMTHAFFKALLFLAAGAVIHALHHEHDIFKMGGLRRRLPVAFWTFLAGGAALAGFPLVTAGFYSKDLILERALTAPQGGLWLWAAGLVGAFVTALYIFRVIFIAFYGEPVTDLERSPGLAMTVPLGVLAVLSLAGGFVELPSGLGGVQAFSRFLAGVFPAAPQEEHAGVALASGLIVTAAVLAGIGLASWLFLRRRDVAERLSSRAGVVALLRLWAAGWGFDWLYDRLFVRPYLRIARWMRNDPLDLPYRVLAAVSFVINGLLCSTQNGRVRWYAGWVVAGTVLIIALALAR